MRRAICRREIWAIVPVKRFADAKQRLSARFSAEFRARLAAAMLEDVVSALAKAEHIVGTVLVTAEAGVHNIAKRHAVEILFRSDDDGINPAVRQGLDHLTERGAFGALVVPGDLAFVTPDGLREAAVALGAGNVVVLAPAQRDGGTNLLGVTLPTTLPLAFGHDSFSLHLRAACDHGFEPIILRGAGLTIDIDLPNDLESGENLTLGRCTADLLSSIDAGRA